MATGGDSYLDTKAQDLSWWQLFLLDVKLFLAIVTAAILVVLGGLLWALVCQGDYEGRKLQA